MDEKKLVDLIEKLRSGKREWRTVDAKKELILKETGDKAEFIKDIAAMANNFEKSYLIIGLNDGSFSDVGPLTFHYTKNDLNQVISGNIDPPVVVDYQEFNIDLNEYALVEIFGENPPYIIARDIVHNRTDRKQVRVNKGTILVRHEDRTEGISRSELEEMLAKGLRIDFKDESELAKKLAFEKLDYWEFLLTAELLKSRNSLIKADLDEIERGVVFRRSKRLSASEFFDWARLMLVDLSALCDQLMRLINEDIKVAWGKPGEAGDAFKIKRAVDKIESTCRSLLEWQLEFRSTIPPDVLLPLKQMLETWPSHYILSVDSIPDKLLAPFEEPNPSGQYIIEIVIGDPPNKDMVNAEIQFLGAHPEKMIG